MYKTRRLRLVLCVALSTALLGQIAAVWLAHTLPGWAFACLVFAAIATGTAATGLVAIAFSALPRASETKFNPLADWLRNIDLTVDHQPQPTLELDAHDARLVTAAEDLVQRVHRYREKLLVRHQRVQRLLRNVTDVLYHTDGDGRVSWITDTVTEMLGYSPQEIEGRRLHDLLADPDKDTPALIGSPELQRYPTPVFRRDGSIAWLLISSRRIDNAEGKPIGSEGICRDGTRLLETQRALDREKERAQVTLASIGDGVITTDARGHVEYLNPRAETMLNINAAQAAHLHFDALCKLLDSKRNLAIEGLVDDCIRTGSTREWDENLTLLESMNGLQGHDVTITIAPIRSEQGIAGTVIVLHDITRLQDISREMSYQANHDLLTGLPNRRAFEHLLARLLDEARAGEAEHALCYLDLDQFKLVNDTCGHNAGDEMLRQLTAELAARLRPEDTVARLGGDEFGVLMRHISIADARAKAETLRAEIDTFRFRWEDKLFRLGVSVGVAAIDASTASSTELLRRADTACYLAKEKGRNQVYVYHGDSNETQIRQSDMQRMQQISDALDNDRFALYAQVIRPLDCPPGTSLGVELLLRLNQSDGSVVGPQNILIAAERYNVAARIDRWVLRNALALIEQAGDSHQAIEHYSINISGQSITDEEFIGHARELIEAANVDPGRLVFEITETTAITNILRAGELIHSLRALGCRFSLDDFGSGLSSFSYLKNLTSDFIKIDGKQVRNILHDPVELAIAESINRLGQTMGLKTVAEHVESRALLDALRRIGVDYVQGYHISKPMPFENLATHLKPGRKVAKAKPGQR